MFLLFISQFKYLWKIELIYLNLNLNFFIKLIFINFIELINFY